MTVKTALGRVFRVSVHPTGRTVGDGDGLLLATHGSRPRDGPFSSIGVYPAGAPSGAWPEIRNADPGIGDFSKTSGRRHLDDALSASWSTCAVGRRQLLPENPPRQVPGGRMAERPAVRWQAEIGRGTSPPLRALSPNQDGRSFPATAVRDRRSCRSPACGR